MHMPGTREQKINSTTQETVQRSYYLDHPTLLSPFETPWSELSRRGYVGGGMVMFVINSEKEMLLNQVPSYREKPVIGRFAGQWNVFTETIERYADGPNKDQFEGYKDNFLRAAEEEFGSEAMTLMSMMPDAFRETDYRDPRAHQKIRVRCVVITAPKHVLPLIDAHDGEKDVRELATFAWMPAESLHGVKLEPNARRILRRMERTGYFQRMSDGAASGSRGIPLVDYLATHSQKL